jgi:hypothetical protein
MQALAELGMGLAVEVHLDRMPGVQEQKGLS